MIRLARRKGLRCFHSLPRSSRPAPVTIALALAVPQIAHVVTSDRGSESAARTARTTYVVTAAQIARNGDRTVADAIENVPGVKSFVTAPSARKRRVGIRGSSSQQVLVLVDGLPVAGSSDRQRQSRTASGRRHRSHRSRRRRRLDAVRFRLDRRRDQHHHGSRSRVAAPATLSTGSFGEQTYLVQTPYLSFQRTYADERLLGRRTRRTGKTRKPA